jgi:tRNA pseudouridine(38-40) synthase
LGFFEYFGLKKMKRLKLTIEYKGTAYGGWQSQKNTLGVQTVLENALSYVLNERVTLIACGRTDAGVHALGQTAHFDTETRVDISRIPAAANSHMPPDVRVLSCEDVGKDFHARFSPKEKTYLYKAYVSRVSSPLRCDTHYQILPPVNMDKMCAAAAHLTGEHDFSAFMSNGSTPRLSHTRKVSRFAIYAGAGAGAAADSPHVGTAWHVAGAGVGAGAGSGNAEPCAVYCATPLVHAGAGNAGGGGHAPDSVLTARSGLPAADEIYFFVTGNGFLYNMVRIMVMAVINAGRGNLNPDDLPSIIENKDRTPVKEIAPAKGLYLYSVEY